MGDLVQVFKGTAPNVRAAGTVAYVGRIVKDKGKGKGKNKSKGRVRVRVTGKGKSDG